MANAPDPAQTFRLEAAELLVQLEESLLDLEAAPEDHALVDKAFRALHTIKGSGGMFGFTAVAEFTHHLENAFDQVRSGARPVTGPLISLTLASLDHIRALIEAPDEADAAKAAGLLASLRGIIAGGAAPSAAAAAAAAPRAEAAGEATWRIRFKPGRDVISFGTNPLLLLNELRAMGPCTVTPLTDDVPPLEELEPHACHMAWDILLTTRQPRSAIDDVFLFVADESQIAVERLPPVEDASARRIGDILVERGDVAPEDVAVALDHQPRIGSLLVSDGKVSADKVDAALAEQAHVRERAKAHQPEPQAATVRVQADRLDSLMDQVGELVIAQARLRQLSATIDDITLRSIAEEIERLSADLRDTTMSIRMLPIGTLFGRFRRLIRDLSQSLGKDVTLTMEGEETELDKTVIESLNDPLVHLIRNSLDHGLESAEDRLRLGKPAAGQVHLSAVHSGAQVLITVRDDGRGMNREAIRAKAEERGLLAPGQEVSDSELFAFVFHPGFSTAKVVSSVSGRGVGMDVVKQTIDALRGQIEVASTQGKGSSVTLKLPLTLAIIDGLLVRVGTGQYVVPLSAVEEVVDLTSELDAVSRGRSFLNIRGDIVPFVRLRELFKAREKPDPYQKVVIVSTGSSRVGLVVDQVIGQYQTVIKSLSKLLDDVDGFSGATILGDGSVALILDVPHLIGFAQAREAAQRGSEQRTA